MFITVTLTKICHLGAAVGADLWLEKDRGKALPCPLLRNHPNRRPSVCL